MSDSALHSVRQLHDQVDAQVRELERHHAQRLQCRSGCASCCIDDITVFEVEAERIRAALSKGAVELGAAHPEGACAFLDPADQTCRIYAQRPYVCRTQGLPLRWIDQHTESQIIEHRDICALNDAGRPITELDQAECWTLGPFEGKLASLQIIHRSELARISLRSLFEELSP
ncbi:MAG: YkgJ family cysteine cluster protein [Myxococcales bacterium]|nr:YkgJ family cysteine cluster protein [Myxococcales bacterium]